MRNVESLVIFLRRDTDVGMGQDRWLEVDVDKYCERLTGFLISRLEQIKSDQARQILDENDVGTHCTY